MPEPELYDEDVEDNDWNDFNEDIECPQCGCDYDPAEHSSCPDCGYHIRDRGLSQYTCDVISSCDCRLNAAPKSKRLRMGFELECTSPTSRPSEVARDPLNTAIRALREEFPWTRDYCITKSDASIHGPNPAELATIPMSVPEHARVLFRAFPAGRLAGNRLRCWSNSSCGLHVHLGIWDGPPVAWPAAGSRKRLVSDLTIGKMCSFMNATDNEAFMIDIAGRGSSNYAMFRRRGVTDYARVKKGTTVRTINGTRHQIHPMERYEVLNCTGNETVEWRLPRPTVRIRSLLKNMDFLESLADFSRLSTAGQVATPSDYLLWLSLPVNRSTYTYLNDWLKKRQNRWGNEYRNFCR